MAKLQSNRYERDYSIKYEWNTIAWAKIMHIGYYV